jgi:hypothetical protein
MKALGAANAVKDALTTSSATPAATAPAASPKQKEENAAQAKQ